MAVVKANGYGHGAVPVARVCITAGAQRLGVALVEEALQLREAGIDVPIHLFQESPSQSAHEIVEADLIPTVVGLDLARSLSVEAVKRRKRVKAHVKVDTGMHRLGVSTSELLPFLAALAELPGLEVEGIYTHLAMAECGNNEATRRQKELFAAALEELEANGLLPPLKHMANSAAAILLPETHYDLVRCGIAVYGLHPGESTKAKIRLTPALALKARVAALRDVAAGEGVSYGHTFKAGEACRVATIPLGYADGYPRRLSNRASVLIKGERLPVAGTICMDQFMVQTGEAQVEIDDEVTVIGRSGKESVSADELADLLGTINYEIVCGISSRVPRLYT